MHQAPHAGGFARSRAMTIARRLLVDKHHGGIYHCISRCVRRAYLCGDRWEHRREWIHERLVDLTGTFAVDVGAYAVMANHLHVIARTAPERVRTWPDVEIARRWLRLYPKELDRVLQSIGPKPAKMTERHRAVAAATLAKNRRRMKLIRGRLSSLSWFMKCLKEPIAHRANREDDCTGHFWESRFKSPRILDLTGLLAALVYVDLNVIRAAVAESPEESSFTSVQDRIQVMQHFEKACGRRRTAPERAMRLLARLGKGQSPRHAEDGIWLAPIEMRAGDTIASGGGLLPLSAEEYISIVDEVGREVRRKGEGVIPAKLAPILERLGIGGSKLVGEMGRAGELIGTVVGTAASRAREALRRGARWVVSTLEVEDLATG
jgi:hypothetical protein